MNGEGCPVCETSYPENFKKISTRFGQKNPTVTNDNLLQKDNTDIQLDSVDIYTGTEFRKNNRYKHEATAIVEISNSGHFIYAQMHNFSETGMCFESEVAIRPGTAIKIKFNTQRFNSIANNCVSIVKWCRGLTDEKSSLYAFGLGVKFV